MQLQIGNKIENNRPASNYRHYRFIIIRKQHGGRKMTDITDITGVTDLIKNGIGMIMVGCSRCAYPSIYFFFHCADTLKITVGCPTRTYPSIRTKNAR